MNSIKRIFAALMLITLGNLAVVGQSLQANKKRSPEEILYTHVAECFSHFEGEDPDECVHIRHVTIESLLSDSLGWLRIPVGIALPPDDAGQTRLDFNPSSLLVRDVLDSIVAADQRYKWSLEDGVVNVLPKASSTPLLDVRLNNFNGQATNGGSIYQMLGNMPEVRRRAEELGLKQAEPSGFIIGAVDTRKFTVRCQKCSVRDVLNSVVRQSNGFWLYREYVYEGKRVYRFQ
jgi:hypothetical protein